MHGYVAGIEERNWDDLCRRIRRDRHAAGSAMWSRPELRRCSPTAPDLPAPIPGVDHMCHGHDPGPEPGWTARGMLCIDTGVHLPDLGHLTIADLKSGEPDLHRFARVDSLLPEAEPQRS